VPDAVQEGSIEELISWTKLKLYTRESQKGTSRRGNNQDATIGPSNSMRLWLGYLMA
jgi:hypothetical protein